MSPNSFLLGPLKKEEIEKVHVQPGIQYFLLTKLGLHVKYESCIFKIEQAMAIFVHQGEAKSQFHKILKS